MNSFGMPSAAEETPLKPGGYEGGAGSELDPPDEDGPDQGCSTAEKEGHGQETVTA